jgi:hypothetical protein
MAASMVAAALLIFAGATANASPAAASEATKTLTVKITSGPEGAVSTPDVSFSFVVEGTEEPGTIFHCALDSPAKLESCSSPFALGPLTPGSHIFYVEATNQAANAYSPFASRIFTVTAPAGAGAGSGGGAPSSGGGVTGTPTPLTPTVAALGQSAARWREGSALAHVSRAGAQPPKGTTFSFTLNEAATAHLSFTQALSGRSVAGRCVALTKHNSARHACRRTITAGALALAAGAGTDHVRFEGRLPAARKLKPGRYTMVLTATAGGLTSVPRSLSFTIVA